MRYEIVETHTIFLLERREDTSFYTMYNWKKGIIL